MLAFLRDRWPLLLVLAVFAAFKIHHLPYPYYWDESWPYASAVKAMHDNGLSLLPGAIDSNLSRGHPMFFHLLGAGWMKVFGNSHIAMHSFPLLISLMFLAVVFESVRPLGGNRPALIALLLVALQAVFIVQSSSLLPEVLLALLCYLSLWMWVEARYLLAGLFLTMAFYTKESGLIVGFVLGIDAIISLFRSDFPIRQKIARLAAVGVPCVLIALFFVLQKQVSGWYVMPVNTDLIKADWRSFMVSLRSRPLTAIFSTPYHFLFFLVPVAAALWLAIRRRKAKYYAPLAVAIYMYCMVHQELFLMQPPAVFAVVFALLWGLLLWSVAGSDILERTAQRRFTWLAGSFIFCFICFSSFSFFTYRYLLPALVPLLALVALVSSAIIDRLYPKLYYPVLAACCIFCMWGTLINTGHGDTDMGSYDAMEVEQKIVDYMEANGLYEHHITAGGYLDLMHLSDPGSGFLRGSRSFSHVRWQLDDSTDAVVFTNIESDPRYSEVKNGPRFRLAYRCEKGRVWGEIYRRRQ